MPRTGQPGCLIRVAAGRRCQLRSRAVGDVPDRVDQPVEVEVVAPAERLGREEPPVIWIPPALRDPLRGRRAPVIGHAHELSLRLGRLPVWFWHQVLLAAVPGARPETGQVSGETELQHSPGQEEQAGDTALAVEADPAHPLAGL